MFCFCGLKHSFLYKIAKGVNDRVGKKRRRMLHIVYRVGDLDNTIKYTNVFVGYGPEDSHFVVELTYNYGVHKYDVGNGFGHFGYSTWGSLTKEAPRFTEVMREAGPFKGVSTIIVFIKDPYEPLCQVMLRVGDLDRALNYYEK
ncbi:hypothetical protein MKW92_007335, partial [Papaver armeniacum]